MVLDMILVDELVDTPTSVSTDFVTRASDITYKEDAFGIQVNYSGGVNVNMTLSLEVSLDGINYSEISDSLQVITDDTGSHIWDLNDSGTHFMRVKITVIAGTINVDRIVIQMRRRH
jgi:hypothetical protein